MWLVHEVDQLLNLAGIASNISYLSLAMRLSRIRYWHNNLLIGVDVRVTRVPLSHGPTSNVESNPRLHWYSFTLFCDWSRKLVLFSWPIRYKIKTNHSLVAGVFPRFRWFGCFSFDFSWALKGSSLFFWWVVVIIFVLRHSLEKSSVNTYHLAERYSRIRN